MKLKYIVAFLGLAGFITSCDVTDLSPKDALTDATYWNTTSDLEMYANKLYEKLDGPSIDKDNTSDNCLTTNYSSLLYNEHIVPTKVKDSGWEWENIRACNFFLSRYQQATGTEADINKYVGEVRFFRALDYFDKLKRFGNIPWYDKDLQTTDVEELYKAPDSRDFVLGKVIEDLTFAITWLPDAGKATVGRLTKDAARTQLARVCLYFGTLKKYHNLAGAPTAEELLRQAVTNAEEVMKGDYSIVKGTDAGSGQIPFEGYPLDYSNLFTQEDLSKNKECILARIYEEGVLYHQTSRQAGGSGTGLSKDFIESFLCKDGEPILVSGLYQGDETLEIEIQNRDPRMYQIVDNKNKPYLVMNGERQVNPYANAEANGAVTGYPCVKFKSPLQIQAEANKTTYDWFVYRYAEILLIEAEAKAELGECTQDVLNNTINLLRDRVEMPHLTINPTIDPAAVDYGYAVTPLLYEIRRERRIELIAEGTRWDDIVRWKAGKLFENPKTVLGIRITPAVEAIYPEGMFTGTSSRPMVEYKGNKYLAPYPGKSLDDAGRKWTATDKRYLKPIPSDQLILNKNLEQSTGW